MKRIVCISLLLISVGSCFASETEHQEIKSVINAYDQSIQAKDKSRFLTIFADPSLPMIAVYSKEVMKWRRALVKKINKEKNKKLVATKTFTLTPTEGIDISVSEKLSTRKALSSIKIVSDGNIANVYFDYVYYIDDKKNNWGSESWQVMQTLTGWKISSVIYSIAGSI
ncbi:MAG: hypothetical protein ACI8WB_004579 [Phenylobacterium sp.]|jgi:hypothetical protein